VLSMVIGVRSSNQTDVPDSVEVEQ
jgi:hypothetical protein